ncbi:hypothetical protein DYB26_005070 [Aphanomyces astaci]|uniref:THH1/TOM1/TOM3 domain-containing protein n=2 Tax=Aphanomyces astaci TaxID=112090 RepID=A0A3R7B9W3_APHAT|nr:hypothetical protein DYB26_005070 [Aphanomyces astaci]
METRTAYVAASSALFAAALCILGMCGVRHVRNPCMHMRPMQTLFVRLDVGFAIYTLLFYLRVIFAENQVFEPISQCLFSIVEGITIFSFFNMMLLLVGGTAAAVGYMNQDDDESNESWLVSPYKQTLDRFRRRLIAFLFVKPVLAAVDGWAVNRQTRNPLTDAYRVVHSAIAIAMIVLTVLTFLGVLQTYKQLKAHISGSFKLTAKFVVVKGMLLLSTLQWSVANAVVRHWTPIDLYLYSTVCVGEALVLAVTYFFVFTAQEPDVPHLDSDAAPFRLGSVAAIWDLFEYPVGKHVTYTAAL